MANQCTYTERDVEMYHVFGTIRKTFPAQQRRNAKKGETKQSCHSIPSRETKRGTNLRPIDSQPTAKAKAGHWSMRKHEQLKSLEVPRQNQGALNHRSQVCCSFLLRTKFRDGVVTWSLLRKFEIYLGRYFLTAVAYLKDESHSVACMLSVTLSCQRLHLMICYHILSHLLTRQPNLPEPSHEAHDTSPWSSQ